MTETGTAIPKLLYTPVEAAQALGISRSSLYVLLARGEITSVRIGTSRRITGQALSDYIDTLTTREPSQPGGMVEMDHVRPPRTAACSLDEPRDPLRSVASHRSR